MITRRQFSVGLAAASSLATAHGLQTAAPDKTFEVGLELYSLRREIAADLPATLTRVNSMGFGEVEVPGYYGLTAAEFRKVLDTANLQATALVTQWDTLDKDIGPIASDLATLGAGWAILPIRF